MKWGRIILVIFGALIVTALGIDAADTISGKDGTLLSQVIRTENGCGLGMVAVDAIPGISCVDQFEVSPGKECPVATPSNSIESQKNTDTKECFAESAKGKTPWGFVTRDQAFQLCARAHKRLPTASEWYGLSLGMTDVESSCNVTSKSVALTGSRELCVAPHGAYDLVGNLWEWISDDVINGTYNSRTLPQNGYVEQIDNTGIAVMTNVAEQESYGNDYFWASNEGVFGIVRGGYYDSGSDAGVYSVHADTPTNAASIGIGFRCVR
jgi:formylglycine-generating enzyme required for sulfatase activity